jgi:hypothetical protein
MLGIHQELLPARWASALINNDLTGLDDDDLAQYLEYLKSNPAHANPAYCSNEPTIARFSFTPDCASLCECLLYFYLE